MVALKEAGARPLLVGGAVRDALLSLPVADFDVEVFGLPAADLHRILLGLARVDTVGQAFTVLKLSGLEGVAGAVDVTLPRRDSKIGPGHKGIAALGDPDLAIEDASRRRDFTINAIFFDPFSGEFLDPQGGLRDLEERILRAVDLETFPDDPLRALRAVQFAARFGLTVEERTARLAGSMPIAELPRERVFGEIEKLLLKAPRPSVGLRLLREWGLMEEVAPELLPLAETPQDPLWHPEGDVFTHTLQVVDVARGLVEELDRPRALAVMLASLCHDLGKPGTTRFEDGRVRSRGHEEAGVSPTLALLDRWNVHTLHGYDVRGQVVALVSHHLKPGQLYDDRDRVSSGAIRRLARKCEAELLYRVARADCLGRAPGTFEPVAMEWFLEQVKRLDVARRPPEPLLRGRDLLALGIPAGPMMGQVLRAVYELQLDGQVSSREEALREAGRLLPPPE